MVLVAPLSAAGTGTIPRRDGSAAVAAISEQTTTGETWTLERALARALEANADLLAAKYDFERQEGVRLQVLAKLLPSVTASAGVNQRDEGLQDRPLDEHTHLPVPPSPQNATALFGYDMSVEVRQVIFDGLSSWNQARRQRLLSKQAYLTLRSTVAQTVSSVRQGFDAILLKTANVAAERRRVEEYVQLVEWSSRKQAEGEVPEFELLRAQAELEGARADFAEAVRSLGQAEQSFRRLLQISASAGPIKLVGKFEPRKFSMPLEEAVTQARANRPDLQAAALAVEAARRAQQAEVGNYLPKIEAFASYGARSSYYISSVQLQGWTYGLLGQWNLFDGPGMRGRRMSLRADRHSADAKLAQAEQGIVSKLHELYEGLQQAQVAMDAQGKSVSLSDRSWHDARRLYEVGSASLEQVLEASMTFRRAETRFGETVFNYNSIVAEIEFSVGGQVSDSLQLPDTWKP